jgi:hypothetical protein
VSSHPFGWCAVWQPLPNNQPFTLEVRMFLSRLLRYVFHPIKTIKLRRRLAEMTKGYAL